MTVSIIIPCRNESAVLPGLLDSIVAQTSQPFEVLVADSHSSDDTVAIAKSYSSKLPIRTLPSPKNQTAAGRNAAAKQATGDVFLFIDADITLPPDSIATVLEQITKRGLQVGGFRSSVQTGSVGLKIGSLPMNGYVRLMSHTKWPIFFSCFFAHRSVYEKIGGFDQELFIMEDYDYAYRARRAGFKFGIIRQARFFASMRRFEGSEGSVKPIVRAIYAELYRYTHGLRITKPLFRYEMGGPSAKKKH